MRVKHTPLAPFTGQAVSFSKGGNGKLEGKSFDRLFEDFLKQQIREADGQRQEMLQRDLTGTRKLLEVLWPVLGTFADLELEHEMMSLSGVKIYGDVFHRKWRIVFEEDHYITHAEKISRDRFSFERARARSMALLGYTYFPYSRDELEKQPEFCRQNLQQLLSLLGASGRLRQLPVYEREVLRCAMSCNRPFRPADVGGWLQLKKDACRTVLQELESKGLIRRVGGSEKRRHAFLLTDQALSYFHHREIGNVAEGDERKNRRS